MTEDETIARLRVRVAELEEERKQIKEALGLAAGGVGLTLTEEVQREVTQSLAHVNRVRELEEEFGALQALDESMVEPHSPLSCDFIKHEPGPCRDAAARAIKAEREMAEMRVLLRAARDTPLGASLRYSSGVNGARTRSRDTSERYPHGYATCPIPDSASKDVRIVLAALDIADAELASEKDAHQEAVDLFQEYHDANSESSYRADKFEEECRRLSAENAALHGTLQLGNPTWDKDVTIMPRTRTVLAAVELAEAYNARLAPLSTQEELVAHGKRQRYAVAAYRKARGDSR